MRSNSSPCPVLLPPIRSARSNPSRTCESSWRFSTIPASPCSCLGNWTQREVVDMLLDRFDPFLAEFDRLTNRAFGTDGGALPMDVVRRGEDLVVRVDLPGVAADQIAITVENQTLTLAVERHSSYGEGEQVLLQERFDRSQ